MKYLHHVLVICSLLVLTPFTVAGKEAASEPGSPQQTELPEKTEPQRIVTIDWTQAETLLALGVIPAAVAQVSDYNTWVQSPVMPDKVLDLGLRSQPNLERLQQLKPDKILISPMFAAQQPRLSQIAPVENIGLYSDGDVSWPAIEKVTRELAQVVNRRDEAEQLIHHAQAELRALKSTLPEQTPPLLMIQFMNANHVRIFGENSLYKTAVNQIGLRSAWHGATNAWGYSLAGIDQLMGVKGQIVVVEPLPAGTADYLKTNQLWQYIIQQSGYPVLHIPAVWSFGAIPSALRFDRLITNALIEEESR